MERHRDPQPIDDPGQLYLENLFALQSALMSLLKAGGTAQDMNGIFCPQCDFGQLGVAMGAINAPVLARAANGVCYAYFESAEAAAQVVARTPNAIMEFASEIRKPALNLWPSPGADFEIMKRIKKMFDPDGLLNRGRLYGQI